MICIVPHNSSAKSVGLLSIKSIGPVLSLANEERPALKLAETREWKMPLVTFLHLNDLKWPKKHERKYPLPNVVPVT